MAQIEVLLEEARNATASLEQSRALSALEHAERLLREHPELPQGAWLMAEQLQLTAEVESTAPDGASASLALRKRAAALEGPRATPFSDHPAPDELEASALGRVLVDGPEPDDALEWDGARTSTSVSTASGEHHVRVSRNGRLLWAGWVALAESQAQLHLPVPATTPCSPDDIGAGHSTADAPSRRPHARCESYVLARARTGGGIEAALCERASCGKVVIFEHVAPRAAGAGSGARLAALGNLQPACGRGLLATGLVLWRAGVFDRPPGQTTTRFVYSRGSRKAHGRALLGTGPSFGPVRHERALEQVLAKAEQDRLAARARAATLPEHASPRAGCLGPVAGRRL